METTADPVEEDFEVWPSCWRSVQIFLQLTTQWRTVAGMGGASRLGLDYCAVESVLRLNGVRKKDHARVFTDLRFLEYGALIGYAKRDGERRK